MIWWNNFFHASILLAHTKLNQCHNNKIESSHKITGKNLQKCQFCFLELKIWVNAGIWKEEGLHFLPWNCRNYGLILPDHTNFIQTYINKIEFLHQRSKQGFERSRPPFFYPGIAETMKIRMIVIASSILLLAHTNFNKSQQDKVATYMKFSSIELYIWGHANKGQSRDLKGGGPPFFLPWNCRKAWTCQNLPRVWKTRRIGAAGWLQ